MDPEFEKAIRTATLKQNLRVDTEVFCDKVAQLRELLSVRHSVFVLGCACSAKTEVWRTLALSQTEFGEKTVYSCLNPKAISSDELYGYVNQATKEWSDGVLSILMRDYRWVLLLLACSLN